MSPLHDLSSARPSRRRSDLSEATDPDLLAATRRGDAAAFGELYRRHEPALRRCARRIRSGAHPTEIDDLVSEAFTKLFAALQRGVGPTDNPVAYLIVTLRNGNITGHRKQARTLAMVQQLVQETELAVTNREIDADVVAAMLTLNPRHRRVLWWTEVEGRRPQDIAGDLGITPDAAAALSYRARRALAAAYETHAARTAA